MRFWRRESRASGPAWLRLRAPVALLAALALAACANSDPEVTGSVPGAVAAGVQTIAFESVDGPPRPVFDRLVAALAAEAERRDLPVVSRTHATAYRVRAYLATYVEKRRKRATLAWAWEVFDAREGRSFRIEGQEPLGPPRADVWAQCDDATLARIAEKGFAELARRLDAAPPARPAPEREAPGGPLVAAVRAPAHAFAGPHQ